MTRQPTCAFELRVETGPCESEGCNGRHHPHPPGQFTCNPAQEHPYIGPLVRCGHSQDEHEDVMAGYPACRPCTEAGVGLTGGYSMHPFQPAAEEGAHA